MNTISSQEEKRLLIKVEKALSKANLYLGKYLEAKSEDWVAPRAPNDLAIRLHQCRLVEGFVFDESNQPESVKPKKERPEVERIFLYPRARVANKTKATTLAVNLYGGKEVVVKVESNLGKTTSIRYIQKSKHGSINVVACTSSHHAFASTPVKDKKRAEFGDEPHHKHIDNLLFVRDSGDQRVHLYLISLKDCLANRKDDQDIITFSKLKEIASEKGGYLCLNAKDVSKLCPVDLAE